MEVDEQNNNNGQGSPTVSTSEPSVAAAGVHGAAQTSSAESPSTRDTAYRPVHKRASTACQLCRFRKTKCDNGKPSCGYCIFQRAPCVYPDKQARSGRRGGPRSFVAGLMREGQDVPNSVLLDRLNNLTSLVEKVCHNTEIQGASLARPETITETPGGANETLSSAFADDGFGRLDIPELAAKTSSCESILRWPQLQRLCANEGINSFALQAAVRDESEARPASVENHHGSIHEEYFTSCCAKFLVFIHVKNPVLDVAELRRSSRAAAEFGPSWDGRGCLVVSGLPLENYYYHYYNYYNNYYSIWNTLTYSPNSFLHVPWPAWPPRIALTRNSEMSCQSPETPTL